MNVNIIGFKSLHSYWENVYDAAADGFLDKNFEILFDYFLVQTNLILSQRFRILQETVAHDFKCIYAYNNKLKLNSVNAYFYADTFKGLKHSFDWIWFKFDRNCVKKGYVINVSTPEMDNCQTEVYFSPLKSQFVSTSPNVFLNSLVKLEISTNYDTKEQRFNNYAALIGEKSNPILLIQIDPLSQPIHLHIAWINPDGINLIWNIDYIQVVNCWCLFYR